MRLPISAPQASGEDVSGVEVAAAISANEIGAADIQTFLVSDEGLLPAAYSPGNWLEPKDGSNQRMMIVGGGQVASAMSLHSWYQDVAFESPGPSALAVSLAFRPEGRAGWYGFQGLTSIPAWTPDYVRAQYSLNTEPVITQLYVVCMQKGHNIPTRGARYFSSPKAAEGEVQMCQRDCALNESANIQECVWKCESE